MFFAILICFAALWVGESLGLLNQLIPLPQKAEAYFKQLEDEYTNQASDLITLKDTSGFILSLIIIALIPAIFEELLFRGCLQKVLVDWTRNAFSGILITSILFSIIHASYYGFLPRLFLGIVLGYLYYYSKNIWLNITAHFLNNAFSITLMYSLVQQGKTLKDAMTDSDLTSKMAIYNTLFAGFIFAAALYFLLKFFKRESERVLSLNGLSSLQINDDTNSLL